MPLSLHTLLLKTLNYCNLECKYCYTQRFNRGHPAAIISDEVVTRSIEDYGDLAREGRGTGPEGRHMMFLWHGGEPMLAGIPFFERALQAQKDIEGSEFVINSMTSNGTLVNKSWLRFMKENQIRVSLSIDGPSEVHDYQRITKDGLPTLSRVMQSAKSLKNSNIDFGVICVVSDESIDHVDTIFDFFIENDLTRLAFLPRVSESSWLSPEKYAGFMKRIFDRWLEHDDPNIHIRELENLIHEILGGKAELCELNGCCGSYLAVNHDGSVYLCDLFIGIDSKKIGNILEMSLKEMLDREETLCKVSEKLHLNDECMRCRYIKLCKGGCLYRRLMLRNSVNDKDIYCEYRKNIIEYLSMRLKDILTMTKKGHQNSLHSSSSKHTLL